jgi:hypothetical protein
MRRGCALHFGDGITPGDSREEYKRRFDGPSYRYAYVTYVADPKRIASTLPSTPWPYNREGDN